MASLQDQLIKAGLSNKQKARQANTEKRKKNKQRRSGQQVDETLQEQVKQDLEKQKQEKQAKDAELNRQKQEALAAKEAMHRILQILQHHNVPIKEGEVVYNFTVGSVVKKLYIDEVTQTAIVNGRLAICYFEERSYLVTAETAEKLRTLDESVVAVLNDKTQTDDIDEDDPYAEFQIPDDLMW